jgi:lipase maturation factor 1
VQGPRVWWLVPTVFWWTGVGDHALTAVVVIGLIASATLTLGIGPRLAVAVCTVCFLSCISVLGDFSAYQSDGMLLEAGFIAVFFAPGGLRPGLGAADPPLAIARFLLLWEWFRIYFESGVVKLLSGDVHWRTLTALDHYFETSPLPSWLGWYAQQAPLPLLHAACAGVLVAELALPWMMFLPRRWRFICWAIVTPFQIGIILTANYAFLNYLVLLLGVLLVDDPRPSTDRPRIGWWQLTTGAVLAVVWYATVAIALFPNSVLGWPARALAPARIANAYGLFAVMTPAEYEIEFQGTRDGATWIPYPFRFKPQDPGKAPGIYAPYQPRFDWNLWFASLGPPEESPWVLTTQRRLVENERDVLALFGANPFADAPPRQVRAVLWRYWFTTMAERRRTGLWWNREMIGVFSPPLPDTGERRP